MSHVTNRRLIIGFPLLKGAILGPYALGVIESGLPTFVQALLIALVSAMIGALGMVTSAIISTRAAAELLKEQENQAKQLVQIISAQHDLKGAVGAHKRAEDIAQHDKLSPKD